MVFGVFDFLQKMKERIQLYYYDTSSQLTFNKIIWELGTENQSVAEIKWMEQFIG